MQQRPKACALALFTCAAALAQGTGTTLISVPLSSSPNPSAVGQAVTLTALVNSGSVGNVSKSRVHPECAGPCVPTGIMTFYDGNKVLGAAAGIDIPVFGSFTLVTSQLAPGVHSLSAAYAGDSYYAAGKSSLLAQTVLALQITTASPLPNGLLGSPYVVALATNAVAGSYTWTLSAGSAPPGLNLSPSGVLSGTPALVGTTSFTVTVSGLGATAFATFSITVMATPAQPTSFILKTIAGGYVPSPSYSGDGGLALQAALFDPNSVAVDGLGNVFVTDAGNNRIRKVSQNGVITTFAGSGVAGFAGDDGPAIAAQLKNISAVALDNAGNVYFGDQGNRVRVVDSAGIIRTFATGFSNGVAGIVVDHTNTVYVSGSLSGSKSGGIFKISPTGTLTQIAGNGAPGFSGDGGPAINSQFNGNAGIAINKATGTLYIADQNNHRVRAISPAGIIQTVAGTGAPGFGGDGGLGVTALLNSPSGVAVDSNGNVYISDSGNNRIRMLVPAGLISTVGGSGLPDIFALQFNRGDGGPATLAPMTPEGTMATDSNGNVYFVELIGAGDSVRMLIPSASTAGCAYSALPAQVGAPTMGGAYGIGVIAAMNGCPWLAFSTIDWVSVTSGASGMGYGIVNFTVSPNSLSSSRSALIPVAGQIVTVSQTGTPCTFGINVQQISAPSTGLSGTVSVTANFPDCPWSASTNAPWLFIISGASGQGSGVVNYSVAANSGTARAGTITVAGQTVTFNQAAAPGFVSTSISFVGSSATGSSPFAAGQLISIYGTQLGPTPGSSGQEDQNGVVINSDGGTQVLFDGIAAAILYASATQVNTVIPCSVAGKTSTQMVVQYLGAQSTPFTVPLSTAAPGIFTVNGTGSGEAVVLNQDYSLNGPATAGSPPLK
jgi:hypothetical protein